MAGLLAAREADADAVLVAFVVSPEGPSKGVVLADEIEGETVPKVMKLTLNDR